MRAGRGEARRQRITASEGGAGDGSEDARLESVEGAVAAQPGVVGHGPGRPAPLLLRARASAPPRPLNNWRAASEEWPW